MSPSNLRTLGIVGLVCAISACTTMGTGVGNARGGDLQANFSWKSTDDRTGTLTASLATATVFPAPSSR
jgi:hypothetical protein